MKKELLTLAIGDIHPYAKNPRKNEAAIPDVKESIVQSGYVAPIIVDENNEILAGHTRYAALKELGKTEVEVMQVTGMTEAQKKKYRLLDNKTAERAAWDYELLDWELEDIDFEGYDFGFVGIDQSFIDDLTEEAVGVKSDNPLNTFNITIVFPKEHEDEIKKWYKENGQDPIIDFVIGEACGDA